MFYRYSARYMMKKRAENTRKDNVVTWTGLGTEETMKRVQDSDSLRTAAFVMQASFGVKMVEDKTR